MQTVTVCPDVKYVQRPSAERTICMHMLTNAMKKIWSCTNVIPARKQYLKLHMDIHTGAPRKQCKYCDKDFSDKSHLHRHMKKCHPTPKSNILLRPIPITIMWTSLRRSTDKLFCRVLPTSIVTTCSFNPVVTIITMFLSNVSSIGQRGIVTAIAFIRLFSTMRF